MILSESEKKRIKGLYGLVTEAETAPPPDESVLIAKKNPFNVSSEIYDKLIYDTRTGIGGLAGVGEGIFFRTYNEKLKDGDYFLKYDRDCLTDFIWKKIKPLLDSLVGKNVRGREDNFLHFTEVSDIQSRLIINSLFKISPNSIYAPTILHFYLKDDNDKTHSFTYYPARNPARNSFEDRFGKGLSPDSQDKLLKFLSDELNPLLDIKKLPDSCFEIREIKREKTDF